MTATALISRSVTNVLIHNAVATNEGSKIFIERLLPTAIGFIVYQRTELARGDFDTYTRNGIMYKAFKMKVQNLVIKQLCQWIQGALDAFKKNYLRELYLIFTDVINYTVLESYKFQFIYKQDNATSDKLSQEQVLRKGTDELLLSISMLCKDKLKTNEFVPYICLTYYDKVTPADYEPPFFVDDGLQTVRNDKLLENLSRMSKHHVALGCVDTSFHFIKCQYQMLKRQRCTSVATNDFQKINKITSSKGKGPRSDITKRVLISSDKEIKQQRIYAKTNRTPENKYKESESDTDCDGRGSKLNKFNCNCLLKKKLRNIEIVECSLCLCLQHVPCLGFLYWHYISNPYICKRCKDKNHSKVTLKEQFISIFRLVLAYTFFNKLFPYQIIMFFPKKLITQIIRKLEMFDVIDCDNGSYTVKKEVDAVIGKYFSQRIATNNCKDESDIPKKKKKLF